MKRFLILSALVVLIAPLGASAYMVADYESKLDLVGRDRRGTLVKDVVRVQTVNGKLHVYAFEHNMVAIRNHISCFLKPDSCKNAPMDADYLNRTRSE